MTFLDMYLFCMEASLFKDKDFLHILRLIILKDMSLWKYPEHISIPKSKKAISPLSHPAWPISALGSKLG